MAALVPFVITAAMITNSLLVIKGYREFSSDLDESFRYALNNDCLHAETSGVSTRLTEENASHILGEINGSRFVNYRKEINVPAAITIDFGDGSMLYLHPLDNMTMIFRYTEPEGKDRVYVSKEISRLVTFERLISEDWGNSPWDR